MNQSHEFSSHWRAKTAQMTQFNLQNKHCQQNGHDGERSSDRDE